MSDEYENNPFSMPVGTVINSSLFEKDKFDETSKAAYKVEIAFERGALDDVVEKLMDAADAEWGKGAGEDDDMIWPVLDGDKLAAKREKNGKNGDAYKGKDVIRANTIFNSHGEDGPGGVAMYNADLSKMDPVADRDEIYNGVTGSAGVKIGTYHDKRFDRNGMKFYLTAFQKVADGERIGGNTDHSALFKPVGRTEGEAPKRRSRAG